jgi:type VI secretion system protein VasD
MAGAACGKTPPLAPPAAPQIPSITISAPVEAKVKAAMNIAAGADVNPDASGRPSPVVLRIYQLKTDALFSSADYFALLGDDQMALGQELISRDEYTLVPSERRSVDVVVSNETRFVGAFAAFRDNRNAQWRALIPAPRRGFAVSVERGRIVLTSSE